MIVTPLEFSMINTAKATALAARDAAASALAQIEAVAAMAALPPPIMAYLPHVLARAGGDDWAMFNGQEGAPVFANGAVTLNGTTDALTADLALDYSDKAIFVVVTVTEVNGSSDAVFQINPNSSNACAIEARSSTAFLGRMRLSSGIGFGATLVNATGPGGTEYSSLNQAQVFGLVFDTDGHVYGLNGANGLAKTTRPANGPTMSRLVVGRAASGGYIGQTVHEVMVLDTTAPEVIESYLRDVAERLGIETPIWSPLRGAQVAIVGDSIAAGQDASSATKAFTWLTCNKFHARRTVYAVGQGQVSPVGMTDPAKIALTFSNVMTAERLAGRAAVICFAGGNDWGGLDGVVPIGSYGDTTPNTAYGALEAGWQMFLANAPADCNLYLCTTVNPNVTIANTTGATVTDYDAALRDFTAQKASARLFLIDTRTLGLTDPEDFADGVHPNDQGYAKIAAMVIDSLAASYGVDRG